MAYLKTIANGVDDLSVIRIINVPKRGIGATTIGRVTAFASEHSMSFYDTLKEAKQIPGIGKAAEKIEPFYCPDGSLQGNGLFRGIFYERPDRSYSGRYRL